MRGVQDLVDASVAQSEGTAKPNKPTTHKSEMSR